MSLLWLVDKAYQWGHARFATGGHTGGHSTVDVAENAPLLSSSAVSAEYGTSANAPPSGGRLPANEAGGRQGVPSEPVPQESSQSQPGTQGELYHPTDHEVMQLHRLI